ncbi:MULTISPECIES: type VI secretion system Vgr family protein [Acinetobacter]|uniref:type VI secretion system Vgr family protein n=1 Tax=Acinetobacter TaxID=469 RepID=UPI0004528A39|nr:MULTISPECIES: type VI secretion system Vgr family protein [Acinetobacter calcoaceticus/baumannii complex]EXC29838.1 rhs element Vgr family protein [Acinetobacter sp. 809848]EXE25895.1 rhs element Vgr family protein [Acinetobacter sp. 907131]EXS17039.1 rhs element Vgr family protein [Acinetobacter sp. 883425]MCE6001173.1 type VI secretion system tip protein VgrG [Acinetobacter pittii]MCE6627579.1 type VI secretion system tip protein VgrG [Acinetobacter pittii]
MLFNIFNVLEKIGLSAQKRAVHVQFSNELLNSQVFLQRIEGQHQLNGGLEAELICLSTSAQIALKQFIGVQVAVDQVTDSGQLFRTTGIVTEASYGQSDGALTLYKLTLKDATNLWHKRRNSRVFMNKSIIEVTEVLFKEWQERSPLFATSLSLDLSGLSQSYDIRPFIMQHNESDYDFLTRLWRSEGVSWLIDEAELFVPHFTAPIQPQKLRLIDDNSQYQALARRSIRYHRSSATEYQDSITGFVAVRTLQPTAVHVQRWQPDALAHEEGVGSVITTHLHSEQFDSASLSLEEAWHLSPAWMQDLKGEDQATASSSNQLEKLNQHFTDMYASQAKYFKAYSSVRDSQVGYWFNLQEHPEIDQHEGADQEFLIIAKNFYNQNNLPKDLHQQVSQLLTQSRWDKHGYDDIERQGNELTLIRRQIKTAPEYNPEQHRPIAYPQRAKVVGPEGETIHVDEWGRIKVRFLFTRSDDHGHDGGAGSNDNDTDSAWVDVLTPWAGEGYGARFLPRIGEVVVIDFFDGNIDRPFVTGRIHEAQRSPTKFDVKGQLPDTKKLSGIRSQEISGSGFNQLRFDDTTGQISTQLQSSHAATQLNLGNLSHPKEQATSQGRGEGFELRTDAWGAVRAGKGMLISTYAQEQAQGLHLDANESKQQLEGGLNNSKALSELAKNQQTDPLEVLDHLKTFLDQIEQRDRDKAAAFKQAIMVLSAPNSMALTSNENIHLSADGHISQTAGDSINLSTQKNFIAHAQNKISFFAAQNGARMYAGKGRIELQAQSDGTDIIARKGIQIISTEDRIEITSPKEIILTADGSQLKINSSGIFPVTGGKLEVKAGQHLFMSGANIVVPKISLPTIKTPYSNKINYNWNINSEDKKELFIINKKNNSLIKTHKNKLDKNNNLSSLRFYTPEEADFTAMIFNSDYIQLKQNMPDSENIDELLEETLLYDEENDDVYTEEEF